MAYQPKSYRKFVATAATATLVASAVTPAFAAPLTDVSDRYKEAVDYLVNNKIAQGVTETQFGVALEIKRVDAAVMLAKALGLNTETAPASGFADVPERAQGAVNALKAAGFVNGKDADTFGAADQLTRGEMALILAKAYNLTGTATHTFTDIAPRYEAAVQALVAAGVTNGKSPNQFGTADAIKRGEFAIFVYNLEKTPVVAPAVTAVEAVAAKTIEVTGTNLQNLKAENIKVSGNTVVSITPNTDGTKATVKLSSNLAAGEETVVTTTINEQSQEFKFTYTFAVNSVAVENVTVDNDTPNQKLTLLVNSEEVDLDYLKALGYTVQFVAFDEDDNQVAIFDGESTTSEDGVLADTIAEGDYEVQVTVAKGSNVLSSELAQVKVSNLDSTASTISAYELTNETTGFEQNSSTLVIGETAQFSEVTVSAGSGDADVTGFTVKSSNAGVISVTEEAGVYTLNAEAPGTAKVTITYGKLTKEVTLTVAATERTVTKVKPEVSSVKVVRGVTRPVELTVTDQYGDPISGEDVTVVYPTNEVVTGSTTISTDDEGVATLELDTTKDSGTAVLYFRDAEDDKLLGTLSVAASKLNSTDKKVIEVAKYADSESEDLTLDLSDAEDDQLTLEVARYNAENVYLGQQDLTGYTFTYNEDIVSVTSNGGLIDVTPAGTKTGSTDIALFDADGKAAGKVRVTVVDNAPELTKVTWVNPGTVTYSEEVINFVDVLNVIESSNDDVVQGVTLSKSVANKVRMNEATSELYLDKNDDGVYNGEDQILGTLSVKSTADSDFSVAEGSAVTGYTTAAGVEGTLVFTLTDNDDDIVATTSVKIDVPAE